MTDIGALRAQLLAALSASADSPPALKAVITGMPDGALSKFVEDLPRLLKALPPSIAPPDLGEMVAALGIPPSMGSPLDPGSALACLHAHVKALPASVKKAVFAEAPQEMVPILSVVDCMESAQFGKLVEDLPRVMHTVPPALAPPEFANLVESMDGLGLAVGGQACEALDPAAALGCLHGHFRALPVAAKRAVLALVPKEQSAVAATVLKVVDSLGPRDLEALARRLPSVVAAAKSLGVLPPESAATAEHLAGLFQAGGQAGGQAGSVIGVAGDGEDGGAEAGDAVLVEPTSKPMSEPMSKHEAGRALHAAFLTLPPRARGVAVATLPAEARPLMDLAEGLQGSDIDAIVSMVRSSTREHGARTR